MQYHNIDKAILLSNGRYGYNNEYLDKAVKAYPDKFKALALVDITQGKSAVFEIENYIQKMDFVGLKIETLTCFPYLSDWTLTDKRLNVIWEYCDGARLIVMIHMSKPHDLESLSTLAKKYINIKFIVSHFGAEAVFGDLKSYWDKLVNIVRNNENIWLETSSITYYLNEYIVFKKSIMLMQNARNELGAEKILWGSDYPCITLYATYYQLIHLLMDGCESFCDSDIEKIMGRNALNLFWK